MNKAKFLTVWVSLTAAWLLADSRASNAQERIPFELHRWLQPQSWMREGDQPVVSLGQPGEFDDTHIFAPCGQQENELFRLWYCGSRGRVEERVFEVGLALSPDGRKFEKSGDNPVFRFGDGKHSILTPTIIREDGKWRMWFAARTNDLGRLCIPRGAPLCDAGNEW